MYYKLYKNLRQLIADQFGLAIDATTGHVTGTNELEDIQWFNNQYEGTIHAAPVVFVEFSPLSFTPLTKQTNTTEINIRLHVVTEVMNESDNDVNDDDIISHEELAEKVANAVEGERLTFGETTTRTLQLAGWTHYHKYLGWMVTLIDLKTKG